jgi:hypothetical protein
MDPNDRKGSAILAFLVDALGRGITAVPFAAPTHAQTDHRARNERHESHVNGAAPRHEAEGTAAPIPGTDPPRR